MESWMSPVHWIIWIGTSDLGLHSIKRQIDPPPTICISDSNMRKISDVAKVCVNELAINSHPRGRLINPLYWSNEITMGMRISTAFCQQEWSCGPFRCKIGEQVDRTGFQGSGLKIYYSFSFQPISTSIIVCCTTALPSRSVFPSQKSSS